jgi:hypothetical protein
MTRILKNLRIDEVSCTIKGANPGAKVIIRKSDATPYLFDDIMLRKATVSDPLRGPRDEPDDDKVSLKLSAMVDWVVTHAPIVITGRHGEPDITLNREQTGYVLLHTPHGRRLAEHLNNLSKGETEMPTVDIMKAISTWEEVLNAQVTPRDGESFAKAFSRKYETDEGYRRHWQNHQDIKLMLSPNVSKSMPTLTPTSTDNPVEAVRQLQQLAAKNGRSFEAEFADPANRALSQKTYSSVPYHAGSEG